MAYQLDRTWIYKGAFYGPGQVDLPDEVAQALEAKGAFLSPQAEQHAADESPVVPPIPAADILQKLAEAGYTSPDAIARASDAELLAVKGIGPASLAQIREAYGGGDDPAE